MNTKSHIRCTCGKRIAAHDVLTTGYLLQTGAQVLVSVKYRCPECKKFGRKVISRNQWDQGSSNAEDLSDLSEKERQAFEKMGPIKLEELLDFHFHLESTVRL